MRIFKFNDKATIPLKIIMLIGIVATGIRVLIWTGYAHTSLLYIAVPFCLSLVLYYLTPHTDGASWKKRFWNNMRYSMIIMFSTSLVLMEGYVCVIMFMPLFFLFAFIAFIAFYISHWTDRDSVNVQIIPVVIALMSLEGVTDATTFNRYNEVTYSQVIQADIETLKQRLTQPIDLKGKRHWILSVFPMPYNIGEITLNEGDVRRFDFMYHRWFITNTHAGSVKVTFAEVDDNRIKTSIDDTSYISSYMILHGTELQFYPIDDTQTRVVLTIAFDRTLDPLWYFEPLERFAVRKGAQYFVNEVLNREV